MQAAGDMFLADGEQGRHYCVRQLRDIKIAAGQSARRAGADGHVESCGWALARAHAKSGDAAMIARLRRRQQVR
jgi:hypothetical protein